MNKSIVLGFALSCVTLGCGGDSDEAAGRFAEPALRRFPLGLAAADALIAALGGLDNLQAINSLRVDGSGVRQIINSGLTPTQPVTANTFERSVSMDFGADALRVDTSRDIVYPFPNSQEYTDIIQGNVGVSTEPVFGFPRGAIGSDIVASMRRQELLLTPHLLLRGFASTPVVAGDDVTLNGAVQHTLIASDEPAPLTLFVDANTGLLTKIETRELDFFERDVSIEVFFSDWQAGGDTSFPRSSRLLLGGREVFSQQASNVSINPTFEAGTFEFPEGTTPAFDEALYARGELSEQWYATTDSVGLPLTGVDASITPVDVAPNVRQLLGATHHSFVVRQAAGLILVDAPLYDDRGDALLDYLGAEYPGVPVTHVVASHFHHDHVAGIREVLGRTQASLVVQESNAEFWRERLAAPSTLRPDALASSPRDVNVLTVPDAGELTLQDASNPVTLYHVSTHHAVDMLLTRDVTSNSVFVVDIYSPGNTAQEGAADLDAAITGYGIPTADLKIVGAHIGGIDDYATLQGWLTSE